MTAGALAGAVFLLFPPFWLSAAAFYTDFLSLLFPALSLGLFAKGQGCAARRGRLLWYALAGLAGGLGALVKATAAIPLVAAGLCLLLRGQWRRLLAFAACAVVGVALWGAVLDRAVYPAQLDRTGAEAMNTPVWHWVMMGLLPGGSGGYDPSAYELTRSYSDPAERSAADRAEALRRLQEMGPQGFVKLAGRKWAVCFGNGALNTSDFLDDDPATPCALHDFLLPGGSEYTVYRTLCGGWLFAGLALAAWGCLRGAKRRSMAGLAPALSVAGLALFLLFWESSPRYITNMLPILALAMPLALCPPPAPDESG